LVKHATRSSRARFAPSLIEQIDFQPPVARAFPQMGRCHGLFSGLFAEVRVPSAYLPTNRHEIDSTLKTPLSFTEHGHY